jgi:5,5'-dehydrodivanillate O-demethylase
MIRHVQKTGGDPRGNSFYMPNVNHVRSALRKRVTADAVFKGQHHRLLWRVPVDDYHSAAFTVDIAYVSDDKSEEYSRIIEQTKLEETVPEFDLAECILAGKIKLKDIVQRVPTYALSHIEDYVSLVGQGAIADREHEHLGRMDAGVILLRKLWERELIALAEGRELKEWRIPDGHLAKSSQVPLDNRQV